MIAPLAAVAEVSGSLFAGCIASGLVVGAAIALFNSWRV